MQKKLFRCASKLCKIFVYVSLYGSFKSAKYRTKYRLNINFLKLWLLFANVNQSAIIVNLQKFNATILRTMFILLAVKDLFECILEI